ncbi:MULTISPECIES: GNAT family N-acetyltransferase [unclassified Exiguobacterium]|uniref:GNAT family N-acetyltransferase n=1 Tax=unclassified Exiguobacterium TaxID=2644629 RepID=UPI001040A77F|nr:MULTISPECIES: GNAT family protein [unclassified Exiguobacterium]TCI36442.1 N-acetyltransferase [Exiguobacterium sp. SH4S7]TCI63390.1 N-acetyltransferase [Exiguobacterium sp. SH0S2]
MTYKFALMTQAQAETIAFSWHYDGEYAFYDMEADEDDLAEFLDTEQRGQSVFAITNDGELVGFVSVHQTDADTIDLGLGMKPGLTGNGTGRAFVTSILDFIESTFDPNRITLSVATFNARAIRVYEACGFRQVASFQQDTNGSTFDFIALERKKRPQDRF